MNKTKVKSTETESDESCAPPNLDLSLLRKPILTSVTGFEEVLRAYEAGTNELRKLLSKECDLIYECKVCRNIFRSLTNFISHKRVYCRSSFNAADHFHFRNNGFMVQDISTIIQAEQKINNNPNAGVLPGTDDKSKDLTGIVEHLLWKQHQSRNSNVSDFYDEIQTSKRKSEESTPTYSHQTLKLNRVNDSNVAVYQSLTDNNDNSNMKDEITEVHNMLKKSNTILGPDGKVLNLFNSTSRNDSPARSIEENDTPLTCQVCNLPFETEKTLKLHLEMKHLPSSYVYQCPTCTQKFSTSAAVLRHLSDDHNKSNRRIRMMRDNIIKKRMRADEVITKPQNTSRELQKLQQSLASTTSDQMKEESNDWNDGDDKNSHTCPSCLKKFDRKAVYTSHVQICSDIQDREQEKSRKRKAKEGAKALESEENSNVSEPSKIEPQMTDSNVNKRKRKRTSKVKYEEAPKPPVVSYEDSSDVVDWNLDDEEEKKKLENIKREIIEDEYKRVQVSVPVVVVKSETSNIEQEQVSQQADDDEDSGLIIDEKADDESNQFKCPQCEKVFETDEKLKYHLTCYHSRQKRFKCKMCEYQGYRKKDTMNHINFVHNQGITMDMLSNFIETVTKAVDEEAVAKQNELKRNQLKIKRKMARERLKKKVSGGESSEVPAVAEKEKGVEPEKSNILPEPQTPPKIFKARRKSIHSPLMSPQMMEEISQQKSNDPEIVEMIMPKRRESTARACKSPSGILGIGKYGKVVKSIPVEGDGSQGRPIRNRIKPVRKDFLYDLSDLLKKEADAHREQLFQSTQSVTMKRELRKRAMSTHTREMPNISTFDQKNNDSDILVPPAPVQNTDELKAKDQRNRRMSVFVPPSRPVPRPLVYKPPVATHKNAGAAYRMALKEFENNRTSLYEAKYAWNVMIEHEQREQQELNVQAHVTLKISAASSILQKLTGGMPMKSSLDAPQKSKSIEEKSVTGSMTAEQLCKKFELINVTSISENEFDIPDKHGINLNPGRNNLLTLALGEAKDEVCVLQECSDDTSDSDDSEPKLEIESVKVSRKTKSRSSRKSSERRRSQSSHQRRLTVMQRLQENKIRKSREQIFQRLIMDRQTDSDSPSQSSSNLLFSEA